MREMRGWMVALCMCCFAGGAFGVMCATLLADLRAPKPVVAPVTSGHVRQVIHVVPGDVICYPPSKWLHQGELPTGVCIPVQWFDNFSFDTDKKCELDVFPHKPKKGETLESYKIPCSPYMFGMEAKK